MTAEGLKLVPIEGQLALPVKPEEYFPMNVRDWTRLRAKIAQLQKTRREYSAIAWASVGVVVSSIFAAIAWAPAYRALPDPLIVEFAWIWPAIIALGALGLILGGMMFWAAHQAAASERVTAGELLTEMDSIRAAA